jgi:hypothetical protein
MLASTSDSSTDPFVTETLITADMECDRSWTRDFAVGQVVLTNDLQRFAVSEHLMGRDINQTLLQAHANRVREYE